MSNFLPIDTIAAVRREKKRLCIACPCGHVVEPDLGELQRKVNGLGGLRGDLRTLRRDLRCGQCGGKEFDVEVLG